MSSSPPVLAAVDWGTTRLRIWLLDNRGAVLEERRSNEGLSVASTQGYEQTLERHLGDLRADADLPVMICGMAGSRQGWIEAPYIPCPARLDEVLQSAVAVPSAGRSIRIVPGVAQRSDDSPDVMRGEETQIAGIAGQIAEGEHLICMPGTHSKWLRTRDGVIETFSTWLTGELFELLSTGSILRHSIAPGSTDVMADNPAFQKWFSDAFAAPELLTGRLFRIRAAMLLNGTSAEESAAALSGLLIGCEIGAARRNMGGIEGAVQLIASGPLAQLYQTAFAYAGIKVVVSDADAAVRAGLMQASGHHFQPSGAQRRQA